MMVFKGWNREIGVLEISIICSTWVMFDNITISFLNANKSQEQSKYANQPVCLGFTSQIVRSRLLNKYIAMKL